MSRVGHAAVCLIVSTVFFLSPVIIQAQATITSTDVVAELNGRLAAKGNKFRKQRVVEREVRRCYDEICGGGDRERPCRRCYNEKEQVTEVYTDVLRVVGTPHGTVNGDLIVNQKYTILPDKFHVHTLDVVNCSPTEQQSLAKTLSVTINATTSVQNTRSVSNTESVSANLRWNFTGVGQAGLTLSGSRTVTLSNTEGQVWSESMTQSEQVTVTAPSSTRSQGILRVIEGGVESEFSGSVTFDAPVDANMDEITRASQLLSPSERTFEIAGTLKVTSASQSQVIRTDQKLATAWCEKQPLVTSTMYASQVNTLAELHAKALAKQPAGDVTFGRLKGRTRAPSKITPQANILVDVPRVEVIGTPGNLCYIAPCNEPLDGFRLYCYFDEDGACDDCSEEYDAVCEPPSANRTRTRGSNPP